MSSLTSFIEEQDNALNTISSQALSYNSQEFWMIQSPYEYIEYYALQKRLMNTAIALRLARGLHDGDHRKLTVMHDGVAYRLPYVIHPLLVCRMLIDLHLNLNDEEEDILLASALCHDMIEDIPFPDNGRELITDFHLDPRVYETVLTVSKRRDFTEEEEMEFFRNIYENKLAVLVKLSDRGNNVEDLYNMSCAKVHEYAAETRKYFYPMYEYALDHYPDIAFSVKLLADKITCLTEAAVSLVDKYEQHAVELRDEIDSLREENQQLRSEWKKIWSTPMEVMMNESK